MIKLAKLDVVGATRLTREGRIGEALAVLTGSAQTASTTHVSTTDSTTARVLPLVEGVTSALRELKTKAAELSSAATEKLIQPLPTSALNAVFDRMGQALPLQGFQGGKGQAAVAVPAGARFEEHSVATAAGTMAYKLYVPSAHEGRALPLIVMLHGCTQSPDDFAAGTRMNELAEKEMFLVAYPAQSRSANASKCWNWFRLADQQRGQGEPAALVTMTQQIMRDVAVDGHRVYVAGLSAGGAAAAILGQTYPDLFAAVGVHSGLACGAATDMSGAFSAMKHGGAPSVMTAGRSVPTIVFHGDRDGTVSAINGDQVIAQSSSGSGLTATVEQGGAPGERTYTRTVQADAAGRPMVEQWVLHGAGHAWSGGSSQGSYTDPKGPDASAAMVRFFAHHARAA